VRQTVLGAPRQRWLNCEQGRAHACGSCDSCVGLAPNGPGTSTSSNSTRPHGGVDDTRECATGFYALPSRDTAIFIIDGRTW